MYGLSTTVSARALNARLQFLEGLRPPRRHESPPHADEVATAVALGHYIHRIGGADIVSRPQIVRRRLDCQPIEPHEALPTSAYWLTAHTLAKLTFMATH